MVPGRFERSLKIEFLFSHPIVWEKYLYDFIWFLKPFICFYMIVDAFYMILYDFWSFLYDLYDFWKKMCILNYTKAIYNIGTEILYFQCFLTTDMFLFSKSIIFSATTTDWRVLSRGSVKTRFKAILKKKRIFRLSTKFMDLFDLVWNWLIN